jgi:hypothetical protein
LSISISGVGERAALRRTSLEACNERVGCGKEVELLDLAGGGSRPAENLDICLECAGSARAALTLPHMPAPVTHRCCQRKSKVCASVSLENDQSHQPKKRAGRVTIRMPTSLHKELIEAAETDGVSMNQYVCALIASGMQWRRGAEERRGENETTRQRKRGTTNEEYERIWRDTFG